MNDNKFVVDDKHVIERLLELEPKKMKRAYINGMKAAVRPLYRQTITNARNAEFNATKTTKQNRKPLIKDIKTVAKDYNTVGDIVGRVYLKPNGMLKWFETGTDKRYTRNGYTTNEHQGKPYTRTLKSGTVVQVNTRIYLKKVYNPGVYRGKIKAYGFFEAAKSLKMRECENKLNEELIKAINKQWEKR